MSRVPGIAAQPVATPDGKTTPQTFELTWRTTGLNSNGKAEDHQQPHD